MKEQVTYFTRTLTPAAPPIPPQPLGKILLERKSVRSSLEHRVAPEDTKNNKSSRLQSAYILRLRKNKTSIYPSTQYPESVSLAMSYVACSTNQQNSCYT
jgi:hypothetical protein